jgi:hypothetical protein
VDDDDGCQNSEARELRIARVMCVTESTEV